MLKKDVGGNGFCGCTWWLVTLTPYHEWWRLPWK
jgi:hypothetical protein